MERNPRREGQEVRRRVDRLIRFSVDDPEALVALDDLQLHPVVSPHASHFKQVPFRTIMKFEHAVHESPV
jgi:hypothetical protein